MSLIILYQLSKKYKIPYGAMQKWAKEGKFVIVKSGSRTYVNEESFLNYIKTGDNGNNESNKTN